MLMLTRRTGESIIMKDTRAGEKNERSEKMEIEMKVLGIFGNEVRLGFEAPQYIKIHREELVEKIHEQTLRLKKDKQKK